MKKKTRTRYLVLAIFTAILVINFLNDSPQPTQNIVTKAAPTTLPKSEPTITKAQPPKKIIKPVTVSDNEEETYIESVEDEFIDDIPYEKVEPYKVVLQYPTQHVFDDSLCNLDEIQKKFEPQLEQAIRRLGKQYSHDAFILGEYLQLNLYSVDSSDYFKEELTARIKQLHKNYIDMLGLSAQKAITLNLVVLPRRSHYLHHISYFSKEIDTSIGVYFGGLNLAFVDFQGADDKALKTALHESVHVLNAHIIGKTPYMFNEGMAEFYENIKVEEGKTHFNESEHKFNRQSYPIGLFFDNEQWRYLNTGQLYYSSWLWTTFMHSKSEGLGALIYFMQKEQEDPCSALSADDSYTLFQEAYNVFETDFNDAQEDLPPYQE